MTRRRPFRLTALLCVALAAIPLAGCGGESDGGKGGGAAAQAAATPPTPEDVIAHLRGALAAIQTKDWDAASGYFHFGPRAPKPAEVPDALASMVAKQEISADGIDILAARGRFGPLAEVFPERGASWAERAEVPLERCYALAHEGGEVAVFAGDDGLKLIRLDDVGKLR